MTMNLLSKTFSTAMKSNSNYAVVQQRYVTSATLPLLCGTFHHKTLVVKKVSEEEKKKKLSGSFLQFGETFSDHMFIVGWNLRNGWQNPEITALRNISLHPAAKVLHYAVEAFEGMKAFRGVDGKVRLFRPRLNVLRFLSSVNRCCMPNFDSEEFLKCLIEYIGVEKEWVPKDSHCSLYIRPTMIATEPTLGIGVSNEALLYIIASPVGSYYGSGCHDIKPVSLFANPAVVRSWHGGAGNFKLGANYAPTLYHLSKANEYGCSQNLWLNGPQQAITEVGSMNIFVFWVNEKGEKELITHPLDGLVLPGIIRQSVLELAREWNEFKVSEKEFTMPQMLKALKENRILEVFGTGTAAVICPISEIVYAEGSVVNKYEIPTMKNAFLIHHLYQTINEIQLGIREKSDWTIIVD